MVEYPAAMVSLCSPEFTQEFVLEAHVYIHVHVHVQCRMYAQLHVCGSQGQNDWIETEIAAIHVHVCAIGSIHFRAKEQHLDEINWAWLCTIYCILVRARL